MANPPFLTPTKAHAIDDDTTSKPVGLNDRGPINTASKVDWDLPSPGNRLAASLILLHAYSFDSRESFSGSCFCPIINTTVCNLSSMSSSSQISRKEINQPFY
jgi:hypothetical protein